MPSTAAARRSEQPVVEDPWARVAPPFRRDGSAVTSRGASRSGSLVSHPLLVTDRYLSVALSGSDFERHTCLDVLHDGEVIRSDTGRGIESPRATTFDLAAWRGREIVLILRDDSDGRGWISAADIRFRSDPLPPAQLELYTEPLRPTFHFTARQWLMQRPDPVERQEGWLNDLNGLIVLDGEFHLFAQRWNKCWIHAVSPDLVHWTELPPAFFEDELESGVQSGSCVHDVENTSGLGTPGNGPLIAFWSRADNLSQCISYSLDRGRTWSRWDGNPLLLRPERDPLVFRDRSRNRWCMVLYAHGRYELLVSPDLLRWELHGDLGEGFECPDFFELPVEGSDESRWVLVRGDGRYSVGQFDGSRFLPETEQLTIDPGPHFYATQTWDASEADRTRRVQAAWMRGSEFPGMPFSQQVSIPCDLTLHRAQQGLRLHRTPVPELETLENVRLAGPQGVLEPGSAWDRAFTTKALRLRAELEIPPEARLVLTLCGHRLTLEHQALSVSGTGIAAEEPLRTIDVLLDTASLEAFVNEGQVSLTTYGLSAAPRIHLEAEGAPVVIHAATVSELRSIWR